MFPRDRPASGEQTAELFQFAMRQHCPELAALPLSVREVPYLSLAGGEIHRGDIIYQQEAFLLCDELFHVASPDGTPLEDKHRFWVKGRTLFRLTDYEPRSPLMAGRVLRDVGEYRLTPISTVVGKCVCLLAVPLQEKDLWVVPYHFDI